MSWESCALRVSRTALESLETTGPDKEWASGSSYSRASKGVWVFLSLCVSECFCVSSLYSRLCSTWGSQSERAFERNGDFSPTTQIAPSLLTVWSLLDPSPLTRSPGRENRGRGFDVLDDLGDRAA